MERYDWMAILLKTFLILTLHRCRWEARFTFHIHQQMRPHKTPGRRPSTESLRKKHTNNVQYNIPYVQWQKATQIALSQLYKDTARLTSQLNIPCPSPAHPPSTYQNWAKAGRTQCAYVNWHRRTKIAKFSSFYIGRLKVTCFNLTRRNLLAHRTPKMVPYKLQCATSHRPYEKVKVSRYRSSVA